MRREVRGIREHAREIRVVEDVERLAVELQFETLTDWNVPGNAEINRAQRRRSLECGAAYIRNAAAGKSAKAADFPAGHAEIWCPECRSTDDSALRPGRPNRDNTADQEAIL